MDPKTSFAATTVHLGTTKKGKVYLSGVGADGPSVVWQVQNLVLDNRNSKSITQYMTEFAIQEFVNTLNTINQYDYEIKFGYREFDSKFMIAKSPEIQAKLQSVDKDNARMEFRTVVIFPDTQTIMTDEQFSDLSKQILSLGSTQFVGGKPVSLKTSNLLTEYENFFANIPTDGSSTDKALTNMKNNVPEIPVLHDVNPTWDQMTEYITKKQYKLTDDGRFRVYADEKQSKLVASMNVFDVYKETPMFRENKGMNLMVDGRDKHFTHVELLKYSPEGTPDGIMINEGNKDLLNEAGNSADKSKSKTKNVQKMTDTAEAGEDTVSGTKPRVSSHNKRTLKSKQTYV